METLNELDYTMDDTMPPNNISVQFMLDQLKEIKHDIRQEIRDLKDDVKEEIEKIDERLSGNDGLMERITALEVKVEELFDREMTPISVASPRKAGYKEHGVTAGIGVSAAAVMQVAMEIVKGLGK